MPVVVHVDVRTSSIWQTNSTLLSRRGACVVIDPAYFPCEIDAIAARVSALGRAEAVVFTHGDWDHVMGHGAFPGVPVWMSVALKATIDSGDGATAARALDRARDFDSRWYVERPLRSAYSWPSDRRGLGDGEVVELAGIAMRAIHLPGHTREGLGLIVEESGLLIVGDYLSPCEIPFVDDVEAYRMTLTRLISLFGADVHEVVPGHGKRLMAAEAVAIARADLAYLDQLAEAGRCRDVDAARSIPLPRAADVVGMNEAHQRNCTKVGLTV